MKKIVLVYIYKDGDDDNLNNLITELKKYCGGALYLILLKEEGTYGPRNVNYMTPRKYSIFTVKKDGYSDEYTVDNDERRKLGDFIRVETVYPATGVEYKNQSLSGLERPYYRSDIDVGYKVDRDSLIKSSPTRTSQLVYEPSGYQQPTQSYQSISTNYQPNKQGYYLDGNTNNTRTYETTVTTRPYEGVIEEVTSTDNIGDFNKTYNGKTYDL